MIAATLVVLISGLAMAWVLRPLLAGAEIDEAPTSGLIDDAEERKTAALMAIIDLEDERDVGKLSESDFDTLRGQYEVHALSALRELDELRALDRTPQDAIETEIARLRADLTCPHCGAIRQRGTACPGCGRT